MMAFSIPASAAIGSWILNVSGASESQGTGPWGTVTATELTATTVGINVTLQAPAVGFLSTSETHNAFVFSLANDGTPGVVSALTAGFVAGLSAINTPFGTFSNSIVCSVCGSGGGTPYTGPLNFTITDAGGISLSSFILSTPPPQGQGGWLFSADILANGATGNVATNTPAIPEPETYAMMLAGLSLLGFVARRRRQGLGGNPVPA